MTPHYYRRCDDRALTPPTDDADARDDCSRASSGTPHQEQGDDVVNDIVYHGMTVAYPCGKQAPFAPLLFLHVATLSPYPPAYYTYLTYPAIPLRTSAIHWSGRRMPLCAYLL